jgi:hypothetical protein
MRDGRFSGLLAGEPVRDGRFCSVCREATGAAKRPFTIYVGVVMVQYTIMARVKSVPGLRGERGLVVAIIWRAAADLDGPPDLRRAAIAYFHSDDYKTHLAWLGLPEHVKPQQLKG